MDNKRSNDNFKDNAHGKKHKKSVLDYEKENNKKVNVSDTESEDDPFVWYGYNKRYCVNVADKLESDKRKYCKICACTPCHKIVFGRYLLTRLANRSYDEWELFEKDYGIDYFHASEFHKFECDFLHEPYKPKYIDTESDNNDFFSDIPECVQNLYYAFRNFLILKRKTNDWVKELKTFMKHYDTEMDME